MSVRYRRVEPRRPDTAGALLAAGAVAAVTGAVTFYLVRLFLAREPLSGRRGPPGPPLPSERSRLASEARGEAQDGGGA